MILGAATYIAAKSWGKMLPSCIGLRDHQIGFSHYGKGVVFKKMYDIQFKIHVQNKSLESGTDHCTKNYCTSCPLLLLKILYSKPSHLSILHEKSKVHQLPLGVTSQGGGAKIFVRPIGLHLPQGHLLHRLDCDKRCIWEHLLKPNLINGRGGCGWWKNHGKYGKLDWNPAFTINFPL